MNFKTYLKINKQKFIVFKKMCICAYIKENFPIAPLYIIRLKRKHSS